MPSKATPSADNLPDNDLPVEITTEKPIDQPIWRQPQDSFLHNNSNPSTFSSVTVNESENLAELAYDEDFYSSLANAVKSHPCLYDPGDPSFRTNEQFRESSWKQVKSKVNFRGSIDALKKEWKVLSASYKAWKVQDENSSLSNCNNFPILYASMAWLERCVIPLPERSPILAALSGLYRQIEETKKRAEMRANSLQSNKKTLPEESNSDIYDISNEENELTNHSGFSPPPPKKSRRSDYLKPVIYD